MSFIRTSQHTNRSVINCLLSVAQFCTGEDTLAYILRKPSIDDVMSYNSLTTMAYKSRAPKGFCQCLGGLYFVLGRIAESYWLLIYFLVINQKANKFIWDTFDLWDNPNIKTAALSIESRVLNVAFWGSSTCKLLISFFYKNIGLFLCQFFKYRNYNFSIPRKVKFWPLLSSIKRKLTSVYPLGIRHNIEPFKKTTL